jgi:hypothetical protein
VLGYRVSLKANPVTKFYLHRFKNIFLKCSITIFKCLRCINSSVSIATRYGLDGPGIESRWGRDFPYKSRPALWPTQPPIQWVPGYFLGVKRPGRGVDYPPHLALRLRKE